MLVRCANRYKYVKVPILAQIRVSRFAIGPRLPARISASESLDHSNNRALPLSACSDRYTIESNIRVDVSLEHQYLVVLCAFADFCHIVDLVFVSDMSYVFCLVHVYFTSIYSEMFLCSGEHNVECPFYNLCGWANMEICDNFAEFLAKG